MILGTQIITDSSFLISGLNLYRQLEDFRDMEREDKAYFEELISGAEPEPSADVIEGKARMKLREDMVVKRELVSEFFEEDFLDTEDAVLLDDLKADAESLGFDGGDIIDMLRKRRSEKRRSAEAPAPFPVLPQRQRREAKKRLNEEVNRTAKLLLNRPGFDFGAREIAFKLAPGRTIGNNFVAAVQLVNHEVDKSHGIKAGQRDRLRTEDFIKGQESLEDILDSLTRQLKKRMSEDG